MFRYHPNSHFIQLYKKLSDTIESDNYYCLKTEDGIDIRKLFIKIVDSSLSIDKLNHILQTFGEIEDMKVNFGSGKVRMKNRGYVTYKKYCDATKALLHRNNFKDCFHINAADTWHQPDFTKCPKNLTFSPKIYINESEILSILNDDCLLHVMSFLDPADLLLLSKVCIKFDDLADYFFRTKNALVLKTVTGYKRMTLFEAKLICEVSKNVTKLSIDCGKFNNQRILCFIPKYFTNLKHLKLIGFKLDSKEFWCQMKRTLLNLELLDLSDNSLIHENFVNCLKKSKINNLKSLDVSNSNLSGNFLESVQFLIHLNIFGCRNINGQDLIHFVNANKVLTSLNIANCPKIHGLEINEILMNAQQLTFLTLNNYYVGENMSSIVIPNLNSMLNLKKLFIHNLNYPPCDQVLKTLNSNNCIEIMDISQGSLTLTTINAISTMKNLRKIIMNFKASVTDDLIDCLIDLEHLEEIQMAGCSNLSTESVLRLFKIRSLKFLDISGCYGFTNDFIIQAIAIIKENMPRPILTINVGLTEIDQTITHHDIFEDIKKYVYLSWTAAKNMEHDYDIDDDGNDDDNQGLMQYNLDEIINILSNADNSL